MNATEAVNKLSLKEKVKIIRDKMAYKYLYLTATGIATLIDLFRVSVFDSRADVPFLVILILLQCILFFNILATFIQSDYNLLTFFSEHESTVPECLFFICNFLCSPLITDFMIFLIFNFLKIVNAMRVNDILGYIQQRWRDQMIKKYEQEQVRMKTQEKENILQRSITRRRRKSMEHTLLMNNVGGGVGSQIREKYIQGGVASSGAGQTATNSGNINISNQVL